MCGLAPGGRVSCRTTLKDETEPGKWNWEKGLEFSYSYGEQGTRYLDRILAGPTRIRWLPSE